MPDDAANLLTALVHYRTVWADAWLARDDAGTTWASIATDWQTEYDALAPEALDPTLATNTNLEGGSFSASLPNVSPAVKLQALQQFRAEVQPSYAAIFQTPPTTPRHRRAGIALRFSPC